LSITRTTSTPAGLTAVRRALEPGPPVDPYALAGESGILFDTGTRVLVGLGAALVIPLPDGLGSASDRDAVQSQLAALSCRDEVGVLGGGVLAFGALPFDRTRPTSLVVPRVTYGREADGLEWVTSVDHHPMAPRQGWRHWLLTQGAENTGESGGTPIAAGARRPSPRLVLPPVIAPLTTDAHFVGMVEAALGAIDAGSLDKVVLARQVDVHTGLAIDIPALLRRWRTLEPNCTVFSMPTDGGRFVGASPELLVHRVGTRVRSRPLAGTEARSTDTTRAAGPVRGGSLLDSSKDAVEHRLVADAIGAGLAPFCSQLDVPSRPDLVHFHNVTHLSTTVTGTLLTDDNGGVPTALDLAAALHPTPAVGGVPAAAAIETIVHLEPQPRGPYAGPVGYVDSRGDGEWMLGIRAATVSGSTARLAAGVGIVRGSEPSAELRETHLKLTAVFCAIAPDQRFTTETSRTG
jgi:menaquinone-specific isochorismate synthase